MLDIKTLQELCRNRKIRWTGHIMNCFFCKGNLVDGTMTFMTEIDGCAIIIKNVPAKMCSQCGEASYSDEVAKKLEHIVDSLRNLLTEIAVADYRSVA